MNAFFVICASALLVQTISAQCIGNIGNNLGLGNTGLAGYGLGYGSGIGYGSGLVGAGSAGLGWAGGCGAAPAVGNVYAANGGALSVSSASPIAPSSISVVSENGIEGLLDVRGQLPLLAAVALEGQVPSSGSAGVNYACGSGNVGIVSEGLGAGYGAGAGLAGAALAGAGARGWANNGLAGANWGAAMSPSGCGCGAAY